MRDTCTKLDVWLFVTLKVLILNHLLYKIEFVFTFDGRFLRHRELLCITYWIASVDYNQFTREV